MHGFTFDSTRGWQPPQTYATALQRAMATAQGMGATEGWLTEGGPPRAVMPPSMHYGATTPMHTHTATTAPPVPATFARFVTISAHST